MKHLSLAISGILLTGAVALTILPSQGYSADNNGTSSSTYNSNTHMNCATGEHYDSTTGKCVTGSAY